MNGEDRPKASETLNGQRKLVQNRDIRRRLRRVDVVAVQHICSAGGGRVFVKTIVAVLYGGITSRFKSCRPEFLRNEPFGEKVEGLSCLLPKLFADLLSRLCCPKQHAKSTKHPGQWPQDIAANAIVEFKSSHQLRDPGTPGALIRRSAGKSSTCGTDAQIILRGRRFPICI